MNSFERDYCVPNIYPIINIKYLLNEIMNLNISTFSNFFLDINHVI